MGSIANSRPKGDWQEIVARKRRDQAHTIESFLQRQLKMKPSIDGIEICSLDHKILLESLSQGDLTAESVALAYINRYVDPGSRSQKCQLLTSIVQGNRSS